MWLMFEPDQRVVEIPQPTTGIVHLVNEAAE